MQQKTVFKTAAFRFRRFCRAGYAAFCSMHRVVNIGHLSTIIADKQLQKAAAVVPLLGFALMAQNVEAQDDTLIDMLSLPVLDVTAISTATPGASDAAIVITRQDLASLTVGSVGELLEQLPGVDLRTRGGNDVQADLSMRGGSFDQVVVLLNGVNLTDAQTGHHNMDIPIDLSMVERVEIIPASALVKYGITSFCGAVNIVTSQETDNQFRAQLAGGSWGQLRGALGATRHLGPWSLMAAASFNRSDGYMPNTDYHHGSLFLQARHQGTHGTWDIQFGGQSKDFGSQAFYSTKYPWQFETTRTLTGSICRRQQVAGWQMEALLYARLHRDRFELFREGQVEFPSWYTTHNYHLSNTEGLRLRASKSWSAGRTTFGAEWRREGIVSNVLGDSLAQPIEVAFEPEGHFYTLGTSRSRLTAFGEHAVWVRGVRLSGSLLATQLFGQGPNYGYAFAAAYPFSQSLSIEGGLVRTFRQPTFNDLYYHSATQISNPELKSEVSHSADLTLRYTKRHWRLIANGYGRQGSDIIDWVRTPDETVWHSMNHASITAFGGDFEVAYCPGTVLDRVSASYSYCSLAQKEDGFISNYVLDYLHRKVELSLVLNPFDHARIKLMANHRNREGHYTDADGNLLEYRPVTLFNAALEYDLKALRGTLFVEGYNLLSTHYCDYGGVDQPGLMIMGGARFRL